MSQQITTWCTFDDIDLLWVKGNRVICSFEIEATTTMTESLNRGPNIDSEVPKFIVIPQEREPQLLRKMKSPMFDRRFRDDSWNVIYFESLEEEYSKRKGKTNIFKLGNKKTFKKNTEYSENKLKQLMLFDNIKKSFT